MNLIDHSKFREGSIQGRYLNLDHLRAHCLSKDGLSISEIGRSVQGEPLYAFPLGQGKRNVLMWSQMHGNESTTTKAVWDLVNFMRSDHPLAKTLASRCRLMIVPMLNPDGARAYTRENFNGVDLNRDAHELSQPESRAIRNLFEDFGPDHCFNLHDQRNLFSAGKGGKPATVSFLSPASNEHRELTPNRETAMKIIAAMDARLGEMIPGQLGRFDDGFNANCIGDTFQSLGVPTILFEAGHFPGDHQRERTREFIFYALVEALRTIALDQIGDYGVEAYFGIPENEKLFFDILVNRPEEINPLLQGMRVGINYREILRDDRVVMELGPAQIGTLEGHFGHLLLEDLDSKDFGSGIGRDAVVDLLMRIEL